MTASLSPDRLRGALVGLAVGDPVGTTVEFMPPGTFDPVTDMVGGGPFDLRPGQWTDDTSMALCLAESLVTCKGFDARDQMERYVLWLRDGHMSSTGKFFDIGHTTRSSLEEFIRTGEPYAGSTHPRAAGNGSAMRLAPVPMFFAKHARAAVAACADSSRTTHGAPVAVDVCRYLGALLVGAFAGATKEELLAPYFAPVAELWKDQPLQSAVGDIAAGSFKAKKPPEIKGTGYSADCLEAALWAFHTTRTFKDGCLAAVNLGNDADTTGAVYGQIAGAFYGEGNIPKEWRERLAHRELISGLAEQLVGLANGAAA